MSRAVHIKVRVKVMEICNPPPEPTAGGAPLQELHHQEAKPPNTCTPVHAVTGEGRRTLSDTLAQTQTETLTLPNMNSSRPQALIDGRLHGDQHPTDRRLLRGAGEGGGAEGTLQIWDDYETAVRLRPDGSRDRPPFLPPSTPPSPPHLCLTPPPQLLLSLAFTLCEMEALAETWGCHGNLP